MLVQATPPLPSARAVRTARGVLISPPPPPLLPLAALRSSSAAPRNASVDVEHMLLPAILQRMRRARDYTVQLQLQPEQSNRIVQRADSHKSTPLRISLARSSRRTKRVLGKFANILAAYLQIRSLKLCSYNLLPGYDMLVSYTRYLVPV